MSHRLGLTESPLTRHPTLTVTSGCCTAETQLRPYSPGHKHKLDRAKHTTAFPSPAGYTQEVCNAPGVRNAPGVSHHHSQGANARTTQQYLKTKEGQFTLSLTGMKKKHFCLGLGKEIENKYYIRLNNAMTTRKAFSCL